MLASHCGQWLDGADLGHTHHDSFIRQDCSGKKNKTVGDRVKHWCRVRWPVALEEEGEKGSWQSGLWAREMAVTVMG